MYQMYKLCDFRTVLKLHSNECYKKSIILPLVLLPMVTAVSAGKSLFGETKFMFRTFFSPKLSYIQD